MGRAVPQRQTKNITNSGYIVLVKGGSKDGSSTLAKTLHSDLQKKSFTENPLLEVSEEEFKESISHLDEVEQGKYLANRKRFIERASKFSYEYYPVLLQEEVSDRDPNHKTGEVWYSEDQTKAFVNKGNHMYSYERTWKPEYDKEAVVVDLVDELLVDFYENIPEPMSRRIMVLDVRRPKNMSQAKKAKFPTEYKRNNKTTIKQSEKINQYIKCTPLEDLPDSEKYLKFTEDLCKVICMH